MSYIHLTTLENRFLVYRFGHFLLFRFVTCAFIWCEGWLEPVIFYKIDHS
ncbi:hypothetical protein MEZE111188_21695 [Mesobacillus zeae]